MAATVESFKEHINSGYTFKKDSIIIGAAIFNGTPVQGTQVKIPLKTLNRHGLIAGATGTGKTKTLQVIAEQMSLKGIPYQQVIGIMKSEQAAMVGEITNFNITRTKTRL